MGRDRQETEGERRRTEGERVETRVMSGWNAAVEAIQDFRCPSPTALDVHCSCLQVPGAVHPGVAVGSGVARVGPVLLGWRNRRVPRGARCVVGSPGLLVFKRYM